MEDELLLTEEEILNARGLTYSPDMDEAELFMVALKGIAQAQLAKATEHYESKLQQMALNYDIICKETDAISYTRGVLEGRKQERERIISHLDKLLKYNYIKGDSTRKELGKYVQAPRRENNEH